MMYSVYHEANGKWADVGCGAATVTLSNVFFKLVPVCERDEGILDMRKRQNLITRMLYDLANKIVFVHIILSNILLS